MAQKVPPVIEHLLASREAISSGEVASAAGVSRQTAHSHLRALVQRGLLAREGAGRGARYKRVALTTERHSLKDLQEDIVWRSDFERIQGIRPGLFANPRLEPILNFAFTEMLNNAIDHSNGTLADVRWFEEPQLIAFEIEDDGIGAFRKVRESRGLKNDFEAIGEISKGKQTTAPEFHSGQGIFFTSKMANRFALSSGHLVWTVDASLNDEAVGWLEAERSGTLVRCEVDLETALTAKEVFDRFSDPETFQFSKSAVRISLFMEGGAFVSRSEAKRVASRLEDFEVVEVDFSHVDQVGQGFVDELFRVWENAHPQTRLIPVNANPAVMAMIAFVSASHVRSINARDGLKNGLHDGSRDGLLNGLGS
jgi:DNA-binding transcriptional ArsR family regulator